MQPDSPDYSTSATGMDGSTNMPDLHSNLNSDANTASLTSSFRDMMKKVLENPVPDNAPKLYILTIIGTLTSLTFQEKKNSVSDTDAKKVTVEIGGKKKRTGGQTSKKSTVTSHLVSSSVILRICYQRRGYSKAKMSFPSSGSSPRVCEVQRRKQDCLGFGQVQHLPRAGIYKRAESANRTISLFKQIGCSSK